MREIMSLIKNQSLDPEPKRQKIEPEINESSSSLPTSSICVDCTTTLDESKVRVVDHDGLQLRNEPVTLIKCHETEVPFPIQNKLYLVLDLDHTLLHSRKVPFLTKAEKYLIEEADSTRRQDLWKIKSVGYSIEHLLKLRPFLEEFLKEANELFIMYVYTKGRRAYAKLVLELIDPKKLYFGDRVITRNESPHKKTLDLVLADESEIVIVDDTPEVWPEHKNNLLKIRKYNYFKVQGQKSKLYSVEKTDESANEGGLVKVLKELKQIHTKFFRAKENMKSMDVRELIQEIEVQRINKSVK